MRAKLTSKNQLTIPKAVIGNFLGVEYFDVVADKNRIVLTPIKERPLDAVWKKIEALGITERDIDEAVRAARKRG